MSARQLEVLVNDQLVGHLREENDLWQFTYAASWIASPQGFALSPALPRAAGLHADGASNRPVQWYFDNLLPEETLRTVIAKEADLKAEDAFGLLAYFGAESAGSLVLRDTENPVPVEHGVKTFEGVRREHILVAAKVLGLAETTATRELDRMLKATPAEADKLIAGELRMLRAARHIVLADMCRQLS